jgi:hypothetical protein
MPVHLSPLLLLWCILVGLALLVIVMLSAFVRRTLIRRRLILLAQEIAAAHPSTVHRHRPCCGGCLQRHRVMTHYRYGEPVRQACVCRSCERRLQALLQPRSTSMAPSPSLQAREGAVGFRGFNS